MKWFSAEDNTEKHGDGSKHVPDEGEGGGGPRLRADLFNDRRY